MMQLNPLEAAMGRLLDSLFAKDMHEIFTEPVDIDEVPDYMDVVTHPMDLGTMKTKLRSGKYLTLDNMENDFNLMIQNCLAYNNKDTIFYRAGIRMRDHCGTLFKAVRKELIRSGIVEEPQSDESLAHEVDAELVVLLDSKNSNDEFIEKLQLLMEKAMRIKHGMIRGKRTKAIKVEIMKAKKLSKQNIGKVDISPVKAMTKNAVANKVATTTDTSDDDDDEEEEVSKEETISTQQMTPPCSPLKCINSSASPSGVNRRTAVLFTRKAQAAASLKKSEALIINEDNPIEQTIGSNLSIAPQLSASISLLPTGETIKAKSPKKPSRGRRINSLTSEPSTSASSLNNSTFHDSKANSLNLLNSSPAVASTSSGTGLHKKLLPLKERYVPANTMPDSFRMYRGRGLGQSSDSDESHMSFTHSSCSSCSGSGSDFG